MRDIITSCGEVVVPHRLFIHAWSGCDTTSATYNQGKSALLKMVKQSPKLQKTSLLMSDLGATQEEIACAGCQVFLNLYGGKATDSLTSLRYLKFMEMMSNGKNLSDFPQLKEQPFFTA